MKTADKIMTICTIICMIISIILAITSFTAGQYWLAVFWMVAFGFDSWDAWRYIGMWIDYHKTIKKTQDKIDILSD